MQCDEQKPSCNRCEEAGRKCVYSKVSLDFRDASRWAAAKSRKARGGSSEVSSDFSDHSIGSGTPICLSSDTSNDGTAYWDVMGPRAPTPSESHRCRSGEASCTDDLLLLSSACENIEEALREYVSGQPILLSHQPQQTPFSADGLYANHFANHVTHILPPILRILCGTVIGSTITNHAAMALGAANLARLRSSSRRGLPGLSPLDDGTHRVNSLRHVGAVLRLSRYETMNIASVIAVQLLLSFVELEIGDLDGFESYVRSIDGYLGNRGREYSEELINDTVDLRQLAYPGDPQYTLLRDLRASQPNLDWSITNVADSAQFRFVGSDAVELNFQVAILTAMQMNAGNPSHALQIMIDRYRPTALNSAMRKESVFYAAAETRRIKLRLQKLAEHLQTCNAPPGLSSLLMQEEDWTLPFTTNKLVTIDSGGIIRFESHEQAMDAADYVFARALCDETPHFVAPGTKPLDTLPTKWLRLLTRIAEGLDMKECARRNKYRRGIVSMLSYANMFWSDARITSLLRQLTSGLTVLGEEWEDFNTPLEVVDLITQVTRECQSQGAKICMTSVRFSKKEPGSPEGSRPAFITLYGQEATGRPLDFFLETDSSHGGSLLSSHEPNPVERVQPAVLYSVSGNAWFNLQYPSEMDTCNASPPVGAPD